MNAIKERINSELRQHARQMTDEELGDAIANAKRYVKKGRLNILLEEYDRRWA